METKNPKLKKLLKICLTVNISQKMLKSYIRASEYTKPASELGMVCIHAYSSLKRIVENLDALLCCCNNKKEERVRSNFALSQAVIATFAP